MAASVGVVELVAKLAVCADQFDEPCFACLGKPVRRQAECDRDPLGELAIDRRRVGSSQHAREMRLAHADFGGEPVGRQAALGEDARHGLRKWGIRASFCHNAEFVPKTANPSGAEVRDTASEGADSGPSRTTGYGIGTDEVYELIRTATCSPGARHATCVMSCGWRTVIVVPDASRIRLKQWEIPMPSGWH